MSAVLFGVLTGVSVVWLTDLGTRYLVFAALGALAASVVLAVADRRRLFLGVFFFSLQLEATMFFAYRGGSRSVGWSGPPGIELPLSFIPAAVLFLMALLRRGTTQARDWDWGKAVGGAGVVLCAASVLSIIPSNEWFLTFCSILRAISLLIVLLAVANTVHDHAAMRLVLWMLPIVLLTQSLAYLGETALGMTIQLTGAVVEEGSAIGRFGGTVGVAPSGFASFIHPLLQYALVLFLAGDRRWCWWRAGVVGAGTLAMLLTYTRAAWAGMALGGTLVIVLGARWGLVRRRRVLAVVLMALVGLAITYPRMSIRLAGNAADAEERLGLRLMARAVIEAHPILGVGAGTYSFEFRKYLPEDLSQNWLYVVHNAYLLRWAETGVLGFVGLIAFLAFAARDAYALSQSPDAEIALFGLGWLGGLTALAWEMYWDIWHGFPYNALLWALCGFAVAVRRIDAGQRALGAPVAA